MRLHFKRVLVAALLLAVSAQSGLAQAPQWYVGAQGGTSFGQGTFRSITEHQVHWGAQGGLFGGYRFNRWFSLEAIAQYGSQTQGALDCCTYWLSEDGTRYMSPVIDETGWYYHDVTSSTGWGKMALQTNFDLLGLFTDPGCIWSLNVGPQIGAVTTKTRLITPDREIQYSRQWHLGLGGQASFGCRISNLIGVSLYGSITCLTGQRFDNMPEHAHRSNLIWDSGARLTFYL